MFICSAEKDQGRQWSRLCFILSKMNLKKPSLHGGLMFPEINYAFREDKLHKSGRFFSGRCAEACHYCLTHLLFPPTVFRETRQYPAATASGQRILGSLFNTPPLSYQKTAEAFMSFF